MIEYTIKHHVRGRIRIEIPALKKLTINELSGIADDVVNICRVKGIREFSANPLSGSVTIKYDPLLLDISAYLSDMASDDQLETLIMKGALHEMY